MLSSDLDIFSCLTSLSFFGFVQSSTWWQDGGKEAQTPFLLCLGLTFK